VGKRDLVGVIIGCACGVQFGVEKGLFARGVIENDFLLGRGTMTWAVSSQDVQINQNKKRTKILKLKLIMKV